MKKILFSSLLVLSLLVTGCTNSNNLQTSNKESFEVEVLSSKEYEKRFSELYLSTASVSRSLDYPFENPKKVDKYFEKYKDYEGDRQFNIVFLDAYKDFINGLVKFKPDDATLNEFHNETIKDAIQTYSILEDAKQIYEEYEECLKASKEDTSEKSKHKNHDPQDYLDKLYILITYAETKMLVLHSE